MQTKRIFMKAIRQIESRIFQIRGKRVMFDSHLAYLYGVKNKVLLQSVKRNKKRFPDDFMFQVTKEEFKILRSQFVTSSWGGRRYLPYAFTEQGVAMLSSVLNSERAILANIQIMRAFVTLRRVSLTQDDLRRKIDLLEKKYDSQFRIIFTAIRSLLEPSAKQRNKIIGFYSPKRESKNEK